MARAAAVVLAAGLVLAGCRDPRTAASTPTFAPAQSGPTTDATTGPTTGPTTGRSAADSAPSSARPARTEPTAPRSPVAVTSTTASPRSTTSTTSTAPASPTTTTTTTATTAIPTSTGTSTSTTTTTVPATTAPLWSAPLDLTEPVVPFGSSVDGRALVAERYGELGGRRVLIIGVIHGDEDAGVAIIDELRATAPPAGVELWLVESINPDGQAAHDRHNAHHVDLNRNFPHNWSPLGQPGDGQYAGPGPASEPETLATVNLITQLRPDITIWYHQDLYTISPSTGRDGRIRERYAALTGLPMGAITGGTYTGVAATWARRELEPDGGVAFIVELGPTLSADEAVTHANAVRTIAAEG